MTVSSHTHANARLILFTEYLFILLPFIVIAIVKIYKGSFNDFMKVPEWSFASAILFGQLLVKLFAGAIISKSAQWQKATFLATFIIVICFVPCLIILSLALIDNGTSSFLINMQIIYFIIATILFFAVGSAAVIMKEKG